jgi:phosphoglucosamine mutase
VRFGTDGVRGLANAELDPESVLALGRATARVLGSPTFLIGRDTRRSGPLLQAAMSAGMASEGADVVDLGVLPTPAIAWLSASRGVPAVVVSASHNPFPDNGIKVFAAGGLKLPAGDELAIERELESLLEHGARSTQSAHGAQSPRGTQRPTGAAVGSLRQDHEATDSYMDHLVGLLGPEALSGLRVVVDCANGAASAVAPRVLSRLGAQVHAIGCEPDGTNINDGCGSTHPDALAAQVLAKRADVGLAVDGDADRLVAVDHNGSTKTGDELMALFAIDLAERGGLKNDTVVVTVMSNLGFRRAMGARSILVVETPVGDRHVLKALEARGLVLGGEQSGHIVFRELATTGDGLLTGLLLLDLLRRSGRPLAELVASAMERVPQFLENVSVPDPRTVVDTEEVRAALAFVEESLGDQGRVLLRVSGTENLVRVMAEAVDESSARRAVKSLCEAVERAGTSSALGAS